MDTPQSNSAQTTPPVMAPAPQPRSHGVSKPILIFAGVGIIVTVILMAMLFLQPQTTPVSLTPTTTVEETPQELTLTLESPADGTLAVANEMLVRGTTTPGATVAVFTETDEIIVETDAYGQFETTVQLAAGINSLNITAYSEDGQEKTITLNVVYDEEV